MRGQYHCLDTINHHVHSTLQCFLFAHAGTVCAASRTVHSHKHGISTERAWCDEYAAQQALRTHHEVDPSTIPPGARAIQSRLVFKIKRNEYAEIEKYKCRLVARGDQQVEGFDFLDVHAPTAQSASFRILLAIAADNEYFTIHQLDVATAFLHGELDEEVYIRAPPGVGLNGKIWKLDKAVYGLRQAA